MSADNPVKALVERCLDWQKLLQYVNKNVMSYSQQKGLLGELIFLKEAIEIRGAEQTIMSWVGPEGADQDFIFPDTWNEIKTVSISSDDVVISSFEQLLQEKDGELTVYILAVHLPYRTDR